MTINYENVQGLDFLLPAGPPLIEPPLSLLLEAHQLLSTDGIIARRQALVERMASSTELLESYDRAGVVGDDDQPGDADAAEDAAKALRQQMSEWGRQLDSLDTELKAAQRWEHGFLYLPELSPSNVSLWVPDSGTTKPSANNQSPFLWYDPFTAVGLDSRSAFGWPATDFAARADRARRALLAYEAWQCENEFWTGSQIPTNFHLSASSHTPTTSPHREMVTAFPDPTPPPGTALGTAVSLSQSLAALDEAVGKANAGVGMIHATPYVVQLWMKVFPFLRTNDGLVRTVNNNVLVPGYGYPGTGPDAADRTVTDGVLNSTTTVTSTTAAFTDADVGRPIADEDGEIPAGAVIVSVTNGTTAVISEAATATETGAHLTISGRGGDATGSSLQWAYATEMVFHLEGDVMTYPYDIRELSPDLVVDNNVEARAERNHALITNRILRAAVLIDTTQT